MKVLTQTELDNIMRTSLSTYILEASDDTLVMNSHFITMRTNAYSKEAQKRLNKIYALQQLNLEKYDKMFSHLENYKSTTPSRGRAATPKEIAKHREALLKTLNS